MREKIVVVCGLAGLLAGCAGQPMMWHRADGRSAYADPKLRQQLELDATACLGERDKAALNQTYSAEGGLAALAETGAHRAELGGVVKGCMAQKGYLLVPGNAPN